MTKHEPIFYHIYNRGVNRQSVFTEEPDYNLFLRKLKKYRGKYNITVLCYCLMPNHFHLLTSSDSNSRIGKFIGDLINSFTKSINVKYNRTGVLFGGKSKRKVISDQIHLNWLVKYILENPVKAKLVDRHEEWKYSSMPELMEDTRIKITDVNEMISLFDSKNELLGFLKNDDDSFDYEQLF